MHHRLPGPPLHHMKRVVLSPHSCPACPLILTSTSEHKAALIQNPRQTTDELSPPSSLHYHDHNIHNNIHHHSTKNKHAISHNPLIKGCLKGPPSAPHLSPHTFPSPSIATLLECLPTPETSTVLSSSSVILKQWSTSSTEECKHIKEFWLGLGEQDRRKHLCPCPPCPPLPLQGVR